MFLVLVFPCFSAIDETQFANGKFCECAVNPGQCNPYCFCDPYCSDFEKSTFTFALPEQNSPADISCDPSGFIAKKNGAVVQEITINGVKCYLLVENPANMPKLTSYTPADFGLQDWSQLASVPRNDSTMTAQQYFDYDAIRLTPNGTDWFMGLIPTAFGSRECNMFLPVAYQLYFPESVCTLPERATGATWDGEMPLFFGTEGIDRATYFASNPNSTAAVEQNKITVTNPSTVPTDITVPANLSLIIEQGFGQVQKITMTFNSASGYVNKVNGINGIFVSSVLDSTSSSAGYDNVKSGYYVGSIVRERDTSTTATDVGTTTTPLKFGSQNILFGVNAVYTSSVTTTAEANTTLSLSGKEIWASLGNIVQDSAQTGLQNAPIVPNVTITDASTTDTANPPRGRWTFMYRKFGYSHKWFYAIVAVQSEVYLSGATGAAQLETVFTELTEDCSAKYIPPGEPEYKPSLSMVFDVFFERKTDSLETVGVLACFAILGTIWSYTVFYFNSW